MCVCVCHYRVRRELHTWVAQRSLSDAGRGQAPPRCRIAQSYKPKLRFETDVVLCRSRADRHALHAPLRCDCPCGAAGALITGEGVSCLPHHLVGEPAHDVLAFLAVPIRAALRANGVAMEPRRFDPCGFKPAAREREPPWMHEHVRAETPLRIYQMTPDMLSQGGDSDTRPAHARALWPPHQPVSCFSSTSHGTCSRIVQDNGREEASRGGGASCSQLDMRLGDHQHPSVMAKPVCQWCGLRSRSHPRRLECWAS